jgi:acyl-coenzyme A thioesterase PaaI-like protein
METPGNAIESAANRCFVCGAGNPIGLRLAFRLDEDLCRAEFTPQAAHMGYDGVTHGGIIFSVLDDVMANWLWLNGERCFTARAEIRYRAPLPIGTAVRIEGHMVKRKGRLVQLAGKVIRIDRDEVVAEATGSFMTD